MSSAAKRAGCIFYACFLGFFLDGVIIQGAVPSCDTGTCPTVGFFFTQSDAVVDHALYGHSFKSLTVTGPRECFEKCSSDCRCVSFNVDGSGKPSSCQLNDDNRHSSPDVLKQRLGFNYYDLGIDYNIKVGETSTICCNHCCKKSYCQNGGTCQETCGEHGARFTCSCPPEYTGKYCESQKVWNNCHEVRSAGITASGIYLLYNPELTSFAAYCDFGSENGSAWTLIESFSLDNKGTHNLSFYAVRTSINQNLPTNWPSFRFSHRRVVRIADYSTHWRATCNFERQAAVYEDFLRASLTNNDILHNPKEIGGYCAKYELVNIRGNHCANCTALTFHQNHFHIDSYYSADVCEFNGTTGAVLGEDNFGDYSVTNPLFRCTASGNSTTQFWIGNL